MDFALNFKTAGNKRFIRPRPTMLTSAEWQVLGLSAQSGPVRNPAVFNSRHCVWLDFGAHRIFRQTLLEAALFMPMVLPPQCPVIYY